mgnify:CR=1 FL=1
MENPTLSQEMQARIEAQWKRLVLPDGDINAGRQEPEGNSYPNAPFDAPAHLAGAATYAVNLTDADGNVRCGVLDLDTGDPAVQQIADIRAHAQAAGLVTLGAVSGRKGAHCWLFVSEPVPKATMTAALRRLAELAVPEVPFEAIPGDNQRIKLPPCKHQVTGQTAYFYDKKVELVDQAKVLEAVTPTPVATLLQFVQAGASEQPVSETPADMVPNFQRLQGDLPPCIRTMLEQGGLPDETYNKAAMTLARYTQHAGLSPSQRKQLNIRLADDFRGSTEKSVSERIRHVDSLKQHVAEPFSCAYMLRYRNRSGFAFQCVECKARPSGVMRASSSGDIRHVERTQRSGRLLETELARQLLHVALRQGNPAAVINASILPDNLATVWQAVGDGVTTAAEMADWCTRRGSSNSENLTLLVNQLLHQVPAPTDEEHAQSVFKIRRFY